MRFVKPNPDVDPLEKQSVQTASLIEGDRPGYVNRHRRYYSPLVYALRILIIPPSSENLHLIPKLIP